ncbi:MAG: helix-turn-helix domain-containing protein [Desulfobulbales bacterium]|nr:helix-turn-helix domain-containing protein [Desulfobulbales bacterium]
MTGNRDEGHRDEFHDGAKGDSRFLGEDTFIETVLRQVEKRPVARPGLDAVEKAVKKLYGLRKDDLATRGQGEVISEARAMAAWAVQELSDSSLTELSRRIGRDVTSLSSAIRRLRQRASRDQALATRMEKIREMTIDFAILQA